MRFMSNDPSANPLDKNQAIQEILYKKREIARLQEHFGITNAELEQAANTVNETPQPGPAEQTTYDHGKKVGAWLKNVLK